MKQLERLCDKLGDPQATCREGTCGEFGYSQAKCLSDVAAYAAEVCSTKTKDKCEFKKDEKPPDQPKSQTDQDALAWTKMAQDAWARLGMVVDGKADKAYPKDSLYCPTKGETYNKEEGRCMAETPDSKK